MFHQTRYQTGELQEVVNEMKKGNIPLMDVDDTQELEWVLNQLTDYGVYKVENMTYDRDARDRVQEPEFEFRIAFYHKPVKVEKVKKRNLMFIDFYFEPEIEETYAPIFGD